MGSDTRASHAAGPLGGPFWRLFAASGISNLSDGVLQAALPLLAAVITRDPLAVSAMASFAFLPWLLLAIPGGALVDRVNRRSAMAVANLFRAGVLAAVAMVVTLDLATLPVLYAGAFLLGCAEVIYDSSARAMLPAVVGTGGLERGNGLLSTVESVGNIFLGAPIGAWLFAAAAFLPFWGNAAGYLLAAGVVLTVAGRFRPERAADTRTTMRRDITDGLRWLARHRLLRALMVTTGLSGLAYSMISGILVLFVLEDLGLSERGYGIALAIAGIGAIVGSLMASRVIRLLPRVETMGLADFLSGAVVVVVGLFPHPILGVGLYAFSTFLVAIFNIQILSLRQALIPEYLFGRVQGAYRTVIWGGIPIGTLVGGALGRVTGLPTVLIVAGGAAMIVAIATYTVLRRHRSEIDAAFAPSASTGLGEQGSPSAPV